MKQCIEKIDLISKFNMHTIYKDYLVLQAVCAFSEKNYVICLLVFFNSAIESQQILKWR